MLKPSAQEAYLITKPEHVYYISGFSGEGFLIIIRNKVILATDQRYWLLANKEKNSSVKLFELSSGWKERLQKSLCAISTVFFEDNHLTIASLAKWKKNLPRKSWKKMGDLIEKKRIIKTSSELNYIRKASKIGSRILKIALEECLPGITEKYLANHIRKLAYEYSDGVSFDPIVAFGKNAAIPHHHPGRTMLKKNDEVLIDHGVNYHGYMSDMTRCFSVGNGITPVRSMYDKLLKVQKSAIQMLRPGIRISDLSRTVRAILGDESKYFTHSLGHGVGLEIHESPIISSKNTQILRSGMVITIEPGLYKPNIGGVRIEDTVIITDHGSEVITNI